MAHNKKFVSDTSLTAVQPDGSYLVPGVGRVWISEQLLATAQALACPVEYICQDGSSIIDVMPQWTAVRVVPREEEPNQTGKGDTADVTRITSPNQSKTVFIVHGRNTAIKTQVEHFLRGIGLKPLEWSRARELTGKPNPYTWEIVDIGMQYSAATLVLFTPDDVAMLKEEFLSQHDDAFESVLTPQPRPNVLFEAGVAYGRNADRTLIVSIGKIRPISDLAGHHMLHLTNKPTSRSEFAARLKSAGCAVDTTGHDWLEVGNFDLAPVSQATHALPTPSDPSQKTTSSLEKTAAAPDAQTKWETLHSALINAQSLLIDIATGKSRDSDHYVQIRTQLMKSEIKESLPEMLVRNQTVDDFWPFIRDAAGKYQERRELIRDAFKDSLTVAERHVLSSS